MPRRVVHEDAESRVLRELEQEDDDAIAKLALEAGPPADAKRLSDTDEDDIWETTDPQVDYEQMAQMVMTQGLPPEMIQSLLITKVRPDWAPLYAQPTGSAEMAEILTRAAQYPFRLSVLEDYDDFEEMTRKAETLDKRFQKRHTQRQEQAASVSLPMGGGMPAAPDANRMQPTPPALPAPPMPAMPMQPAMAPDPMMTEGA